MTSSISPRFGGVYIFMGGGQTYECTPEGPRDLSDGLSSDVFYPRPGNPAKHQYFMVSSKDGSWGEHWNRQHGEFDDLGVMLTDTDRLRSPNDLTPDRFNHLMGGYPPITVRSQKGYTAENLDQDAFSRRLLANEEESPDIALASDVPPDVPPSSTGRHLPPPPPPPGAAGVRASRVPRQSRGWLG